MSGPVRKVTRSQSPDSLTDSRKNLPQISREATEEVQGRVLQARKPVLAHTETKETALRSAGDICSLTDAGSNTLEQEVPGAHTPSPTTGCRQDRAAAVPSRGERETTVRGGMTASRLISYQGKKKHISPSPWANNLHWADVFSLINCHSEAFLI